MNLNTTYLGFKLPHPFMVGSSPLAADMDMVRRLEDAGTAAIVMHSLFEEQITREMYGTIQDMELHAESSSEALSYFPKPEEFRLGPEQYLEQIRKIKAAVHVPVIASLNGTTSSGWLDYARQMEQAGADALELNVYYLPTDVKEGGKEVEHRTLEAVKVVKDAVSIPIAVKLSPFFSSLPNFAAQLEEIGTDALVLFNRFIQPDIDIENLEVTNQADLSSSGRLLVRLRWLAILHGNVKLPLAVTGGVHKAADAVKAIMAGASAVQMVSSLMTRGPEHLRVVREEVTRWMEAHEYESLEQMCGSMDLQKSPNPAAFQRANYMRILTGWRN